MDQNLFESTRRIANIIGWLCESWQPKYSRKPGPDTFRIEETKVGPKLVMVGPLNQTITCWPTNDGSTIHTNTRNFRAPKCVMESLAEYFKDPKAFMKKVSEGDDDMTSSEARKESVKAIQWMIKNVHEWAVRDVLKQFTEWGFWRDGVAASLDETTARKVAEALLKYVETTPQDQDVFDIHDKVSHYLTTDESKVSECDVPGTMVPQETPDIKAEDSSMEDYSDLEDPNKLKDKTKENDELAGREVKDKELEQKPPETKESKVNEVRNTRDFKDQVSFIVKGIDVKQIASRIGKPSFISGSSRFGNRGRHTQWSGRVAGGLFLIGFDADYHDISIYADSIGTIRSVVNKLGLKRDDVKVHPPHRYPNRPRGYPDDAERVFGNVSDSKLPTGKQKPPETKESKASLDESRGYAGSGDWGVRWREAAGSSEKTKQKFFDSKEELENFVDKLEKKDSFIEVVGMSKPSSANDSKIDEKKCPKCGHEMRLGAPHGEGTVRQWECHNCGKVIAESKVKEDNYQPDPEPRPESYKDEEGDTVYILPDVEFTDIKSTVRDALAKGYESFLYGRLGSGEGIANKDKTKVFWGADVQDYLPRHYRDSPLGRRDESKRKLLGYRIREKLRFCNACNKTFRSNESKCKCGNKKTEVLGEREYSDLVGHDKPIFKVQYTQDGQKAELRVAAFDEDDAKRSVERMKRGAKATKATRVSEGLAADSGKQPEDFDKDQLEAGTKVEMEHTDNPDQARQIAMDHLTEDPEYYTKLRKMEAGKCAGRPRLYRSQVLGRDVTIPENESKTNESQQRRDRDDVVKSLSDSGIEVSEIGDYHFAIPLESRDVVCKVLGDKKFYGNPESKSESKVNEKGWFYRAVDELKADEKFQSIIKKHGVDSDEAMRYVVNHLGSATDKQLVSDVLKAATGQKFDESRINESQQRRARDQVVEIMNTAGIDAWGVGDYQVRVPINQKVAVEMTVDGYYETQVKRTEEGKVPDDADPEDKKIEKLTEGVLELVGELVGIGIEDQKAVRAAVESGAISNDWPSDDEMIDELSKLEDVVDPTELEKLMGGDDPDIRQAYVKFVLVPKAISTTESKVAEANLNEPAGFESCVERGGRVRTVSGPDKEHGLKEGEYVRYCYIGDKSFRGEVKTKKDESKVNESAFYDGDKVAVADNPVVRRDLIGKIGTVKKWVRDDLYNVEIDGHEYLFHEDELTSSKSSESKANKKMVHEGKIRGVHILTYDPDDTSGLLESIRDSINRVFGGYVYEDTSSDWYNETGLFPIVVSKKELTDEEVHDVISEYMKEDETDESKVTEQGPVSASGQMPPIPNKPAPGQKPESPEEKRKREALVSAAAKAVEAFGEDELEAYAEQIKKRQQQGKK